MNVKMNTRGVHGSFTVGIQDKIIRKKKFMFDSFFYTCPLF
jgi:hypothetical protein